MRKLLVLFTLTILASVHAQKQIFFRAEFAARRAKLMAQIGPDGVGILLGAETPYAYVRFRQDNNFFYFTGVEVPDAVAVLDGATQRTTLYVPERSSVSIAADKRVRPGAEGEAASGLETVLSRTQLSDGLTKALSDPKVKSVHLILAPEETAQVSRDQASAVLRRRTADAWDGRLSRARNLERIIKEKFPALAVTDLTQFVDEQRWVKSASEIAALRECGRIGAMGFRDAVAGTKPGMFEYQIAALATGRFLLEGASDIAFMPIAASGENTLEFHYEANNRKMESGDVVLLDFAPEYQYYVTDITRTWPVGGRFTDDQLKMYNCVLDAHKQTIAAVKPGVTFAQLTAKIREVFTQHGFGSNMVGGAGHFVGMSVHDPGFYNRPFVAGVVFNVEPLFVDRTKKIHMRLEDTIVVTATGNENLTAGMPCEVEPLYGLMKR